MRQHFSTADQDLVYIERLFTKIEDSEEESSHVTVLYHIFARKFLDFTR